MTYQEILEGITRHRANPIEQVSGTALVAEIQRKVNEIEWALQALAEKLRDDDVSESVTAPKLTLDG